MSFIAKRILTVGSFGVIVWMAIWVIGLAQNSSPVQAEAEVDSDKIAEKVNQAIREIHVDKIVEDALNEALRALEKIDLDVQIQQALNQVDVDEIVREALEESRRVIDKARIEEEVREALKNVDVQTALKEAQQEIEKAREEIARELEKLKAKNP